MVEGALVLSAAQVCDQSIWLLLTESRIEDLETESGILEEGRGSVGKYMLLNRNEGGSFEGECLFLFLRT